MADEVTAAQAALLTGLSERTIRRRIASGYLPARRLSANRFAIRVDDLPLRGGGATVVARFEALDARLKVLEEAVASLQATVAQVSSATMAPTELPEAPSADQLRALISQLGQETERLAPILGFAPQEETTEGAPRRHEGGAAPEAGEPDRYQPRARKRAAQ